MNILLALLVAILLSAFQYLYKRKAPLLFALRTLMYFAMLLLLLDLKIEKQVKNVVKPDLYVLADNTQSIAKQKADKDLQQVLKQLQKSDFNQKFNLHYFKFDNSLQKIDTLSFLGTETDLGKALKELKNLHNTSQKSPVILISDGQSTLGENYIYSLSKNNRLQVFPVAVGDTMQYTDIKIDLLNVNPFAYKGNRFPVEIFASYNGESNVSTKLIVKQGKRIVYQKRLAFSKDNNSQRLSLLLEAKSIGNKHFSAYLTKIENEHNLLNNSKYFSVEIINNAKKILLLSNIIHPDLGVIKRSLSKDKYLQIINKKPSDKSLKLTDYQAVILYQPTTDFTDVFKQFKTKKLSWLIISGKHTDWQFINKQKLFFSKQTAKATEQYFPVQNQAFSLFKLPELTVKSFTPLTDYYGTINLQGNTQTAYFSSVKGIVTSQPLWVFNNDEKQALIAGENIWQWRMQAGLLSQSEQFDQLLQQTVQYLSLNKQFDRLKLQYQRQYFQGESIAITAQVLDKNLAFNDKAQPVLSIKVGEQWQKIPMSNQGDFFQANVSNLPAGTYHFTVSDKISSLKKSGSIVILPFSLEDKNLQTDILSLQQLAKNTQGKVFDKNNFNTLIDYLSKEDNYPSISHITNKKMPLVDYKWLLFAILLLLAVEWFLKKLRGEL